MGDFMTYELSPQSAFTASLFHGNLPGGWSLSSIGRILKVVEYGLNEPVDASGDTPIVGMRDLFRGAVNLQNLSTVNSRGKDWSSLKLHRGDILLNRTNSPDLVGKVGIVREDSDAVFASYLVRLQVDHLRAYPEYVAYWLNSDIAQRALKRLSTRGVSQANINPTEFQKHCPIPLPPIEEQKKIAAILRTWDEATEKFMAAHGAKLKRHRVLTTMLVFGCRQVRDFPTTTEVIPYRWFSLPASWTCPRISELAKEISERNVRLERFEVLSCSKHDGFVRSLDYFKKQIFSNDLANYKKIWRGDFGFPSNHIEEGSIGLQNLVDIGVVSPIYTVFRMNPGKVNTEYAFAVLKTELYRHIFEATTSSSVDRRGSLRWSEFSRLPFPLPPVEEQQAIADVLRTSRAELDALSEEIRAVGRQKRGLMQKLLTGEWRVRVDSTAESHTTQEISHG